MATITAARLAYKQAGNITDAQCVRIVRQDGAILRFTDAAEDLTMDEQVDSDGVVQSITEVTYTTLGYTSTANDSGLAMTPGSIDLEGILASGHITRNDIKLGLYTEARVYLFYTNYLIPLEDEEKIANGYWGQATLSDGKYSVSFITLIDILNSRVGRTITPKCTADLGDADCGVKTTPDTWQAATAYTHLNTAIAADSANDAKIVDRVKPSTENMRNYTATTSGISGGTEPIWPTTIGATVVDGGVTWETVYAAHQNSTVDSTSNNYSFVDAAITEVDDLWTFGIVEFLTGNNTGFKSDIKSQVSTLITLKSTTPFDIQTGDTFIIRRGCGKRIDADCKTTYRNLYNYRAFPYLPGKKKILTSGDK